MAFAVLHIEKGTKGKAGGLGNHIDRKINVPNADPALSDLNYTVVRESNGKTLIYPLKGCRKETLQNRIDKRIEQGYKGSKAIRKDAVTHLNIVLTGSHDKMQELFDTNQLQNWLVDNYNFVVSRYGIDNVVDFTLHMDERTPHVHCVVVPLTPNGRLSAKEVMGDRLKLSELQTEYGKAMQKYELRRGIKGSKATHESIREYYARINESLEYIEGYRAELDYAVPPIEEIPKPPLIGRERWAEEQNKAIREAYAKNVDKIKENALNQLRTAKISLVKTEEKERRLLKQRAQLHGIIDKLKEKLNPKQKSPEQKNQIREEKRRGRKI